MKSNHVQEIIDILLLGWRWQRWELKVGKQFRHDDARIWKVSGKGNIRSYRFHLFYRSDWANLATNDDGRVYGHTRYDKDD